jgi:uncharacterized membrane protein
MAARSLTDVGIDDGFSRSVREKVSPGLPRCFLLTRDAVADRVADRFVGAHAELIQTNLSSE